MTIPATLVLADGTTFSGISIGSEGQTIGEVTFNTAMAGYQEVLTDPASAGQLIAFTYPHIGNTGVNEEDNESDRVRAAGLIIRDLPLLTSNFRSEECLGAYLRRHRIIGISGIDTRRLTRHLRSVGSQMGCITTGDTIDINAAKTLAQNAGNRGDQMPRDEAASYEWQESAWMLGQSFQQLENSAPHVVVVDFGITRDLLRHLVERGCRVTVVPATMNAEEMLSLNPDGLLLSNGAGNPEEYVGAIEEITKLIARKSPLFAVGLGHQLLGLAFGGKVEKLLHGRHGVNHPVQDIETGKVMMTTQNQHYTLVESSLPETVIVTHYSLVDQSVQGIRLNNQSVYSFQGYPEGDADFLFDQLINAMRAK